MIEECPFNYSIVQDKWMFLLVKSKNKLKYSILFINIFQWLLMVSFIYKHRYDYFDTLIFTIYLCLMWISVIVRLLCHKSFFQSILIRLFLQTNAYLIICRGDAIQEIMKYIEATYNSLMVIYKFFFPIKNLFENFKNIL